MKRRDFYMKVRKAIIPAAGLGTRVLPATKAMPKEMLPIVDKPAIQFIVEEAVKSGIEDICIITNRGKVSLKIILIVLQNLKNVCLHLVNRRCMMKL